MRLDQLDLTRYGRFTDARLRFDRPAEGAPDLHVIFGPNEAGKSTLFSAWLDLLYGIAPRTRYDFLHPGPTLQIGARLTHAGGAVQVVRVKRAGPSLQDANGQPLPEAVLQTALAGLGRDGYTGMFSLDDDTLEQGGESILASRGDLGEMLFAASAGLAGLSPQLDAVRRELDSFHKPRGRSTVLKQAKDRLADLDRQRRELDVTAAAAQKLVRDVAAAEKDWAAARQAEARADDAVKRCAAMLALVPQHQRLARLREELMPLADLPQAEEAQDRALVRLDEALRAATDDGAARAAAVAELSRQRDAVRRDPAILPMADQIAQAQALYPLHQAARGDLPRRIDSLAGLDLDLQRRMRALDLRGEPAEHVLPGPSLARLRALLTRRDVARQAAAQTAEEAERSAQRLQQAQTRAGAAASADLAALGHLVARLRQSDPEARQARAAQDLAARAADLTQALAALAPWRGDVAQLAAQTVPAPWQWAAWQAQEAAAEQALRRARDQLDRAEAACRAAEAKAQGSGAGDGPTLDVAAEARRQREAAWAAHLADMTAQTAARFESALRIDDRMSLDLARSLAAASRAAEAELERSRLQAEAAAAAAAVQARQAEAQALQAVLAAVAADLGVNGAGLADLQGWLGLRARALAAADQHRAAQEALAASDHACAAAATDLAAALGLEARLGLPRLMAEALARLDQAALAQEAARRRDEAQAEHRERLDAAAQADQGWQTWQKDWQAAAMGTALAGADAADPALATLLDELDHLSRLEAERRDLADRIIKMEANAKAFQDVAQPVLAALGEPEGSAWEGVTDRLAAALQAERDHARISAELARAAQGVEEAAARKADLLAQRAALAVAVSLPEGADLGAHLSLCRRASQLRRAIAELEAELAAQPAPDQPADVLEAAARQLTDALTLARSDSEARFAALTAARQALAAVGGDDAVARIAAERANLLHALADQARAHLALRFGLMAFEQGLHRYRDSHRSAMLARASRAFAQLTRGQYVALAAQPDGPGEVLVAIPAAGGAKRAADLSKGTRFQLYLALRIAGYHEMAKARPPVPFIADDIMETFDDGRAEQAFALLADMALTGQVIYLTHHRHLCDMARRICPGAAIIDLQQIEAR